MRRRRRQCERDNELARATMNERVDVSERAEPSRGDGENEKRASEKDNE